MAGPFWSAGIGYVKTAKAISPLRRTTLPRLLSECGGDDAGACVGGGLRREELNGIEEEVAEAGEECERQPTLPTPHYPAHRMLRNIAALIARTGTGAGIALKDEDESKVTLRLTRVLVRLL